MLFRSTATLLSIIGNGVSKMSEIASRAGKNANEITEPLKKLRDLGYVRREVPFDENERNSKKEYITLKIICSSSFIVS